MTRRSFRSSTRATYTYPLTLHPLTHSPAHPLTHSPTLTRSPAHPLTRSPTHPLTHPRTHSPTHPRTTTAPTFLQELHQSYLEAAHAFSEQGGQQKKRGKRGVPRDSASRESRESVGSNRRRSSGSSGEQGGEVLLAATAPPATRAPTPDVDGLGKTEFVVSMLVSLGCVEWAAMQNRQPSRGFGHNSPSITPRQRQVMLRVTSLARASLTANWQTGSGQPAIILAFSFHLYICVHIYMYIYRWVDAIPVMQHFDMLDQRGAGKLCAEELELTHLYSPTCSLTPACLPTPTYTYLPPYLLTYSGTPKTSSSSRRESARARSCCSNASFSRGSPRVRGLRGSAPSRASTSSPPKSAYELVSKR